MPWNGATGAIARCKSRSTACAHKSRFVPAWRWICGGKPTLKAGNKTSPHSIRPGLDKPGDFTTVSVFVYGKPTSSPGFPIHPPRRHMALERSLEGRDQLLKLVKRQAREIQELHRTGLQLGEPYTCHGSCLLSLYGDVRGVSYQKESGINSIGVLRDAPADQEGNARLLSELFSLRLLRPRRQGGYIYQDGMRNWLLQGWRSNDDKRAQFDQFNQRLVTYYEEQHETFQHMEQDLGQVADIVRHANPARYVQLVSTIETRLVASLLEGLYHATLRSVEAGYSFFNYYRQVYEKKERLTVCQSLLNAAYDYFTRLPPSRTREVRL